MKNRKGFTIVELVIVIAVIAILAAVLIPTFSGVIDKANTSARTQEITNSLKAVLAGNSSGSLDNNTVFVKAEKEGGAYAAKYFSKYDGNKLHGIYTVKSADDDKETAVYDSDEKSLVAADTWGQVILAWNATNGYDTDAIVAIEAFFNDGTATTASNKLTFELNSKTYEVELIKSTDLEKGIFVLVPAGGAKDVTNP